VLLPVGIRILEPYPKRGKLQLALATEHDWPTREASRPELNLHDESDRHSGCGVHDQRQSSARHRECDAGRKLLCLRLRIYLEAGLFADARIRLCLTTRWLPRHWQRHRGQSRRGFYAVPLQFINVDLRNSSHEHARWRDRVGFT
jgi:hypothetical protein